MVVHDITEVMVSHVAIHLPLLFNAVALPKNLPNPTQSEGGATWAWVEAPTTAQAVKVWAWALPVQVIQATIHQVVHQVSLWCQVVLQVKSHRVYQVSHRRQVYLQHLLAVTARRAAVAAQVTKAKTAKAAVRNQGESWKNWHGYVWEFSAEVSKLLNLYCLIV